MFQGKLKLAFLMSALFLAHASTVYGAGVLRLKIGQIHRVSGDNRVYVCDDRLGGREDEILARLSNEASSRVVYLEPGGEPTPVRGENVLLCTNERFTHAVLTAKCYEKDTRWHGVLNFRHYVATTEMSGSEMAALQANEAMLTKRAEALCLEKKSPQDFFQSESRGTSFEIK